MITHRVHEFMDDLRLTWCGIVLAPGDPRPADDAVVDCMSCLVVEARLSEEAKIVEEDEGVIGRVISINRDGTVTIKPLTGGVIPWP